MTTTAACPACSGTGRQPLNLHSPQGMSAKRYDRSFPRRITRSTAGTVVGRPCLGGDRADPPAADGTPCLHEYTYAHLSRCYGRYTCIHCGWSYDIDTGD